MIKIFLKVKKQYMRRKYRFIVDENFVTFHAAICNILVTKQVIVGTARSNNLSNVVYII